PDRASAMRRATAALATNAGSSAGRRALQNQQFWLQVSFVMTRWTCISLWSRFAGRGSHGRQRIHHPSKGGRSLIGGARPDGKAEPRVRENPPRRSALSDIAPSRAQISLAGPPPQGAGLATRPYAGLYRRR